MVDRVKVLVGVSGLVAKAGLAPRQFTYTSIRSDGFIVAALLATLIGTCLDAVEYVSQNEILPLPFAMLPSHRPKRHKNNNKMYRLTALR